MSKDHSLPSSETSNLAIQGTPLDRFAIKPLLLFTPSGSDGAQPDSLESLLKSKFHTVIQNRLRDTTARQNRLRDTMWTARAESIVLSVFNSLALWKQYQPEKIKVAPPVTVEAFSDIFTFNAIMNLAHQVLALYHSEKQSGADVPSALEEAARTIYLTTISFVPGIKAPYNDPAILGEFKTLISFGEMYQTSVSGQGAIRWLGESIAITFAKVFQAASPEGSKKTLDEILELYEIFYHGARHMMYFKMQIVDFLLQISRAYLMENGLPLEPLSSDRPDTFATLPVISLIVQ